MSTIFTRAALEEIARCAGAEITREQSAADVLCTDYFASADAARIGSYLFDTDPVVEVWGLGPVLRFRAFAELIELAVASGYVDLHEFDQKDKLRDTLEDFCRRDEEAGGLTDLTLLYALAARLNGNAAMRVDVRDDSAFHAYAAFLRLVDQIRRDEQFIAFALQCAGSWSEQDDFGFLISPQHFAEALVKGRIGRFDANEAAGGARVVDYLIALCDLEERTAHVPDLWNNMLRQARWCHHVDVISQRLALWFERMAEWPGLEVDEAFEEWTDRLSVLRHLSDRLHELGLRAARPTAVDVRIAPTAAELRDQGRIGAAINAQRHHLSYLNAHLGDAGGLQEYVDACIELAELDGAYEAAAWLSKVEPQLRDDSSAIRSSTRERAFAVLGEARVSKSRGAREHTGAGTSAKAADRPYAATQMEPQMQVREQGSSSNQ